MDPVALLPLDSQAILVSLRMNQRSSEESTEMSRETACRVRLYQVSGLFAQVRARPVSIVPKEGLRVKLSVPQSSFMGIKHF